MQSSSHSPAGHPRARQVSPQPIQAVKEDPAAVADTNTSSHQQNSAKNGPSNAGPGAQQQQPQQHMTKYGLWSDRSGGPRQQCRAMMQAPYWFCACKITNGLAAKVKTLIREKKNPQVHKSLRLPNQRKAPTASPATSSPIRSSQVPRPCRYPLRADTSKFSIRASTPIIFKSLTAAGNVVWSSCINK